MLRVVAVGKLHPELPRGPADVHRAGRVLRTARRHGRRGAAPRRRDGLSRGRSRCRPGRACRSEPRSSTCRRAAAGRTAGAALGRRAASGPPRARTGYARRATAGSTRSPPRAAPPEPALISPPAPTAPPAPAEPPSAVLPPEATPPPLPPLTVPPVPGFGLGDSATPHPQSASIVSPTRTTEPSRVRGCFIGDPLVKGNARCPMPPARQIDHTDRKATARG